MLLASFIWTNLWIPFQDTFHLASTFKPTAASLFFYLKINFKQWSIRKEELKQKQQQIMGISGLAICLHPAEISVLDSIRSFVQRDKTCNPNKRLNPETNLISTRSTTDILAILMTFQQVIQILWFCLLFYTSHCWKGGYFKRNKFALSFGQFSGRKELGNRVGMLFFMSRPEQILFSSRILTEKECRTFMTVFSSACI